MKKRRIEDASFGKKVSVTLNDLKSFSGFSAELHDLSRYEAETCKVGEFSAEVASLPKRNPSMVEKTTFDDLCNKYPDAFQTMFSCSQRKQYYLNYLASQAESSSWKLRLILRSA